MNVCLCFISILLVTHHIHHTRILHTKHKTQKHSACDGQIWTWSLDQRKSIQFDAGAAQDAEEFVPDEEGYCRVST